MDLWVNTGELVTPWWAAALASVAVQLAFSQRHHTMGAWEEAVQPLVGRVPGVGEAGMLAGGIPVAGGTVGEDSLVNNRVLLVVVVQALLLEVVVVPDPEN